MMVECKEMNVPLDEKVLEQVLRYNQALNIPYILISNGVNTFGFTIEKGVATEINELPTYA
jgi:tagatose-1,6-bisphosphate aldolase